ncbi:organic cation transporter 1-like [Condylostylus longicornis]|uniref:organic cation transporter 1-like n=1 Tax=Condylostylus longicornis TaxID=2530218 RepID=UPI00244E23A2|nr:organic cation transporter 1-like [Condylostylus longicornis]
MNYDQILEKCGNFNRYQFVLLGVFAFINFMLAMHYFSQTIISFVPEHWCHHEKLENLSFHQIKEIYSGFENPSCTKLSDIVDGRGIPAKDEICDRWIYNYEFGYRSMTTELNWVCHSSFKSTIGQSFFFVGSVVGTSAFGVLADKLGRLPVIILSNLTGAFGDFVTSFSNTVVTFSFCRFLSGLAADSNYYMTYILVLEYLRPSMRTTGLNFVTGIFYPAGLVACPWLAVWVGHWQIYLWCASIPLVIVIFSYFILIESPQWNVTRKDYNGAVQNLKRMAKFNGRVVPEETFKAFEDYYSEKNEETDTKVNFFTMFKTPRLRKLTSILLFKSVVITLCYDVVSRNVENMGISAFIMFTISSMAVLPSCMSVVLLQDRLGRKAMASMSLFIGGVFTAATGIIVAYQQQYQNVALLACMLFIARYGVCISYESSAQYAAELIPTCVRGQAVGAVHLFGYGVTFLSAYIIYLGKFFKPLPSIILCILLFSGSFLCLLLPETMNKQLPNTLEDGEKFGLGEKMFDFPWTKKQKEKMSDVNETDRRPSVLSMSMNSLKSM